MFRYLSNLYNGNLRYSEKDFLNFQRNVFDSYLIVEFLKCGNIFGQIFRDCLQERHKNVVSSNIN